MDYAAALFEQNDQFSSLIYGADQHLPVPTCPGWTVRQLLRHLGRGHRWAAQMITDRATDHLDPRAVRNGKPPQDPAGTTEWLRASARAVVDAVSEAGADTPVWTFLGPRPASWWIRRRLHEETVHRVDAACALGVDHGLTAPLAADAISEWLDIITARRGSSALDPGVAVQLLATDGPLEPGQEWVISGGPDGLSWRHEGDVASVTLCGPAVDLLLALVRRRPAAASGIEITGDDRVWDRWLDHTPF